MEIDVALSSLRDALAELVQIESQCISNFRRDHDTGWLASASRARDLQARGRREIARLEREVAETN